MARSTIIPEHNKKAGILEPAILGGGTLRYNHPFY